MATKHEEFWTYETYAVVGHSEKKRFPKLTYNGLKAAGKKVFAVDLTVRKIENDTAYDDFASLPTPVDAVVLEVPKEETAGWMHRAVKAGIGHVWIHQGTDSPEALALARDAGLDLHYGTCAVMYFSKGVSMHGVHKVLWKAFGKY